MRVDLEIGVLADVVGVDQKLDSVGDSALRLGDDVERGFAKADGATSRLDSVADSADGMASSSSQAAGGIGDLGGALALMPGPLGAVGAGMEAAAPAIMGVTGAADLLNLATKATIIQKTREKVALLASTVATKSATIAQRALNIAMRANPLGLIITGLILIAGLFVLLYKRSETFRRIVDTVVSKIRAGLGLVVDKLGDVVDWVSDKVPAAWESLRSKVSAVIDKVKGFLDAFRDKITGAGAAVRDKLGAAFDWVMDKVQPIIDAVQWIIDKIGSIDLPDIPFLGRATGSTSSGSLFGTTSGGVTYVDERTFSVEVTVQALASLDPAVLRALIKAIGDELRRQGAELPSWVVAA